MAERTVEVGVRIVSPSVGLARSVGPSSVDVAAAGGCSSWA